MAPRPSHDIKIKNFFITALVTVGGLFLLFPVAGNAQSSGAGAVIPPPLEPPLAVTVSTPAQSQTEVTKSKLDAFLRVLEEVGASAFKNALGYFLNNIAIDTATYIATGGEGQKPLFYTEGWGAYLERLGDNAAGHFIQGIASGFGFGSICNPRFNLRLGLTLGLKDVARPPEPECSFSKMLDGWESAFRDPLQYLEGMQPYFSAGENELAASFDVYTNYFGSIGSRVQVGASERYEAPGGIKPLTDNITKGIKTPAGLVYETVAGPASEMTTLQQVYTGKPVADAIDTFTQTLASKFLKRVFEKGLAGSSRQSQEERFNWDNLEALTSPAASPRSVTRDEIRQDFTSSLGANIMVGNPSANRIDVTIQLLSDGVIDSQFKSAIDRHLTVAQAIEQGLLHIDGAGSTFAYASANKQPAVNEGYSHNSLTILRKYRILPVGWELAAAYISENFQDRIYSLGDIIRSSETPGSPFYKLIDRDWVLKAPDTFCRMEGASDSLALSDWRTETITDTTQDPPKEYDFNRHTVARENYCADSKSCIFEDDKGDCIYYGYCTEEKSLWRFNAQACPAHYNTCDNFTDSNNETFSFLASTLDAKDCSVNQVGCQWYCSDYNPRDSQWACLAQSERIIKPCDDPGGCPVVDDDTGRTCTIPFGHVRCVVSACSPSENILLNGSFEAAGTGGAPANGWERAIGTDREIIRAGGLNERVAAGSFSIRIRPDGINNQFIVRSSQLDIGVTNDQAYTLSGRIYSNLIAGHASLAIMAPGTTIPITQDAGCQTDPNITKGEWVPVNCVFSVPAGPPDYAFTVGLIVESADGGVTAPAGTVWFDDIIVQPECPQRSVVVFMNTAEEANESKLYFDRDVKECDQDNEGCHEFIRTAPGLGTNLVSNGGFERWDLTQYPEGWTADNTWSEEQKATDGARSGNLFVRLDLTNPLQNIDNVMSEPLTAVQGGRFYILSFYAKRLDNAAVNSSFSATVFYDTLAAVDQNARFTFRANNSVVIGGTEWTRYVSDRLQLPMGTRFRIDLVEDNNVAVGLDDIMIEEVARDATIASAPAEYGAKNNIFLKQAPAYLECSGNPETDHSACADYALQCTRDEVGCQMYSPVNGDPDVPGVTTQYDICPRECAGYQAFNQTATNFEQQRFPVFFIAPTGQQCTSQQAGCDEFTNLDKLARGGEAREYFTYLRQCQKPDNSCRTFYTWIGSDVAGYQLQVYNLRDAYTDDDNNGVPEAFVPDGEPDLVATPRTDLGDCTTPQHAFENPNCREFFSVANGISDPIYRVVQNTISCADECTPYRQTETTQADCEASGGYWGVCANGANQRTEAECGAVGGSRVLGGDCYTLEASCPAADWQPKNLCVYQAIPAEGETCTAEAAGCREYRGNESENVRVVFYDNLESATSQSWVYGTISSDALAVGGHSLRSEIVTGNQMAETFAAYSPVPCADTIAACNAGNPTDCFDATTQTCVFENNGKTCNAKIGDQGCGVLRDLIIPGAEYVLQFWAKSTGGRVLEDLNIQVRIPNPPGGPSFVDVQSINPIRVDQNWQEYTIGPFRLNANQIRPDLSVLFNSAAIQVNYDYVTLKLVSEYNYVIKNSWSTPVSCDTNPNIDSPVVPNAPQYMLGCQEYSTGNGQSIFLKSFDRLCRESAVGCEQMIDTHNSDSPFAQSFNESRELSRIDVPADNLTYMVNDPEKTCFDDVKGCMALGIPTLNPDESRVVDYDTTYLVNNPDEYGSSLCTDGAVGCSEFVSEQQGLVYFRNPKDRTCEYRLVPGTSQFGWFKKGSTSGFPDCPTAPSRLGSEQPTKSCIGGTTPGRICVDDSQCVGGSCVAWTGLCTEEYASCNAYIDPQSQVVANVLPNGNFEGYFKICSGTAAVIPCFDDSQCVSGGTCGPQTSLSSPWQITGVDLAHLTSGGIGNSAMVDWSGNVGFLSQRITLEKNTLYTVLAKSKETGVGASPRIEIAGANNVRWFAAFDGSVRFSLSGDQVTLTLSNPPVAGQPVIYKQFAGRFFVAGQDVDATVRVYGDGGMVDDVEIKKTGTYYYLSKEINKNSCNGVVNPQQGCVLFNDTSQELLTFNSLSTQKNSQPAGCEGITCDSNAVIKVTPDRDCGKWLECVSGREQVNYTTGKKELFCQQFATCDALNPINGQCSNFPPVQQTEQLFDEGSVDLIKNYSGYSKVGFSWDAGSTVVDGYYPYSAMQQKRVCVKPSQRAGQECIEDEDCHTDPLINDGVCQPVLTVADDTDIYESCRVYPEGGSPRWTDKGPVDTGDNPAASIIANLNNPMASETWLEVGLDSRNQKNLTNASECRYYKEKSYFEGIYGFCVEKDPRSPYLCLNWLPVDEITGGWIGISGWVDTVPNTAYYCSAGATLEYRTPRTERKCYKEDIFFGPLLAAGSTDPTLGFNSAGTESCGTVDCPKGYVASVHSENCGSFLRPGTRCFWSCTPDPNDLKFTDDKSLSWYDYLDRVDRDKNFTKKHLMYCPECADSGTIIYDPEAPTTRDIPDYWMRVCDNVVKVTADDGTDKGWKQRLEAIREYDSFGYIVPDYGYDVDTVNSPFGRIGSRFRGDPGAWEYITDEIPANEFDRPYFSIFPGEKNVGQIYHDIFSIGHCTADPAVVCRSTAQCEALTPLSQCLTDLGAPPDPTPLGTSFTGAIERIKRLFAQSYGSWTWNGSNYEDVPPNTTRCVGGTNNGDACTLPGGAACIDGTSTCNKTAGYCEYTGTVSGAPVKTKALDESCSTDAACGAADVVFCATGFCSTGDETTSSRQPCRFGGPPSDCSGGETCEKPQQGYGYCSGTGKTCTEEADCPPAENCTGLGGAIGYCSTGLNDNDPCGGTVPAPNNCEVGTAVCVGVCSSGSARAGADCRTDAACKVNGTCELFNYWVPPTNQCANNIRPNYFTSVPFDPANPTQPNPADPNAPGDWCGVAPEVFNISVEQSINTQLFLDQGGNVTLTFNVKVEDNQLPLKRVEIDWGDGTPNTINAPGLGIRDKADLKDPFSFPHFFQFNDARATGAAGSRISTYDIRILIKDNWGWCTCSVSGAQCGPDIDSSGNIGQCKGEGAGGNAWIRVPTQIIVRE